VNGSSLVCDAGTLQGFAFDSDEELERPAVEKAGSPEQRVVTMEKKRRRRKYLLRPRYVQEPPLVLCFPVQIEVQKM
jgi:hypothetical protein